MMNQLKVKASACFLLLLNFFCCIGIPEQKAYRSIDDISVVLYDNWYVKGFSSLPISALSDEDAQKFIEQSVSLRTNLATVFNDTCVNPNYIINKVNANTYLSKYRTAREAIGIKSDMIYTIELSCKSTPKYSNDESPEFNYVLLYDNNRLSIIYNGIVFHLEKMHTINKKSNVTEGDTVKCMYYQNVNCTGYTIQGTRKKGKVVHVTPNNKNVPLESEEEKPKNKK